MRVATLCYREHSETEINFVAICGFNLSVCVYCSRNAFTFWWNQSVVFSVTIWGLFCTEELQLECFWKVELSIDIVDDIVAKDIVEDSRYWWNEFTIFHYYIMEYFIGPLYVILKLAERRIAVWSCLIFYYVYRKLYVSQIIIFLK